MDVLRYAAFSSDPAGGNPAGVVLDASGSTDLEMLAVAAEVGFSETAFLVARADRDFDVRYFSPLAEVPFCGHATIAAGVAFAERHGPGAVVFHTQAGVVPVRTETDAAGPARATLTSVPPRVAELDEPTLDRLLAGLRWSRDDLDDTLPPRVAFAGAHHPVIAAATPARLAALDYDFSGLATLMADEGWTTIDLVHRIDSSTFRARNPFPPGGVVEDPATGAAAAAFGGYLRALALLAMPATITVHQGAEVGRPGVITVDIPADPDSGVSVTGAAVAMDA